MLPVVKNSSVADQMSGGLGADCKLGLTIVRPIHCQRLRCSAIGRMATYHVGSRRIHVFFFYSK